MFINRYQLFFLLVFGLLLDQSRLHAQYSPEKIKLLTERGQATQLLMSQKMDEAFKILLRHLKNATDEYERAEAENELARGYLYMRDYRKAVKYYNSAVSKFTEEEYVRRNKSWVANYPYQLFTSNIKNQLGHCYLELGDLRNAQRVYQRVVSSIQKFEKRSDNPTVKGSALWTISRALHQLGRIQKLSGDEYAAKASFLQMEENTHRMMELQDQSGYGGMGGTSTNYYSRAQAQYELAKYAEALKSIEAAQAESERVFKERAHNHASGALGFELKAQILRELGRSEEAIEAFNRTMAIAEDDVNSAWLRPEAAFQLGKMYERVNQKSEAEKSYRHAIDAIEDIYSSLQMVTARQGFMEGKLEPYTQLALLLCSQKRWEEAFEIVEASRSRALLDTIGNVPARESATARVDQSLLDREAEYSSQIGQLVKQIQAAANNPQLNASSLRKKLRKVRKEYALFRTTLSMQHPGYAVFQTVKTTGSEELAKVFSDNEYLKNTVLLEYLVGEEKVIGFCFDGKKLHSQVLTERTDALVENVNDLRELITRKEENWKPLAQKLEKTLLTPLITHLKGKERILFVPHQSLNFVPFAILSDSTGKTLIERYEIGVIPSASILSVWADRDKKEKVDISSSLRALAVANPDGSLPFGEQEAKMVSDAFEHTDLMVGEAAQELKMFAMVPPTQFLHIATHGVINPLRPEYSHLVLAEPSDENAEQDGLLDVHEIVRKLDVTRSRLVVLSACETAIGPASQGSEVQSLSNAFLYAGAREVIASLWPVDDQSTASLMRNFYEQCSRGSSPMGALRASMIKSAKKGTHPYYWAGFRVIGDH